MARNATTPLQVYLTVRGGAEAIAFYQNAFGATVDMKEMAEDGSRILHATLAVFGHHIMLSDEFPEHDNNVVAPASAGATTVTVHVNLASSAAIDEVMARAANAGARITMPGAKMFWGAYYGRLIDPMGHSWSFAAEIQDD